MTNLQKSMLICLGLFLLPVIFYAFSNDNEKVAFIGLGGICLSVVYLLLGIILVIPKQSRQVGQGMLLSSGLLLLIGFGLCSTMR